MSAGGERTWLAECYSPAIGRDDVADAERRARAVAEGLRAEGTAVAYLGALLVAEDEVVFHAFEADSPAAVRAVVSLAGIDAARIVEAQSVPLPGIGDVLADLLADC